MRIKIVKKVCRIIALLQPIWILLLYKLYKVMNFKLTVYVLLCIIILALCQSAMIVSIMIDKKGINEKSVSIKNKICVCSALVGTVIILITWMMVYFRI